MLPPNSAGSVHRHSPYTNPAMPAPYAPQIAATTPLSAYWSRKHLCSDIEGELTDLLLRKRLQSPSERRDAHEVAEGVREEGGDERSCAGLARRGLKKIGRTTSHEEEGRVPPEEGREHELKGCGGEVSLVSSLRPSAPSPTRRHWRGRDSLDWRTP